MKRCKIIIALFGCILSGCQSKEFENFDSKLWKKDENGCKGDRLNLVSDIIKRKKEILGYTEIDILKNFGKPDMNDLRRRQQKFYYYYIHNPEKCSNDSIAKILKFRFNAIDHVQEIIYE